MSAGFTDLHDVAQVLVEHIRYETGIVDVQVGAPLETGATTEPGVRITLLAANLQPAPRNEPPSPIRGPQSPPLRLSCLYLVSTSGAEGDDPIAAHIALGKVIRLYHEVPVLQLPLSVRASAPAGVFTDLGQGQLKVTQVALTLDQVAHIWLAQRQ
ncbi:MAG: Pvc16 family protein, partial [Dermatophilaceae bacterium]